MTGRQVPLVVLRHGPTDWNAERRIQGRADRPLSTAGAAAVRSWHLPTRCSDYRWLTSPLLRARQTAELMGRGDAAVEPALIEMDWGTWEGQKLSDLRSRFGAEMAELEARGLDFRPPEGESPRHVQRRLQPWLTRLADESEPVVAVAHKGVIRALLSLASGWDMTGRPPEKLRNDSAQCFLLADDGAPRVECLNLSLLP